MSAPRRPSMLIVDDDVPFRTRLARAFRDRGFDVREAGSVAEARTAAGTTSPELAVVDLRLVDGGGLEVVRHLKSVNARASVVVLTGYGSIATAVEAVQLGATHYLTKPADADEILAAFSRRQGDPALPQVAPGYEVPSLARVEWEHIQSVLAECDGNVSRAARLLGLHRRSLQRKLAKFPANR